MNSPRLLNFSSRQKNTSIGSHRHKDGDRQVFCPTAIGAVETIARSIDKRTHEIILGADGKGKGRRTATVGLCPGSCSARRTRSPRHCWYRDAACVGSAPRVAGDAHVGLPAILPASNFGHSHGGGLCYRGRPNGTTSPSGNRHRAGRSVGYFFLYGSCRSARWSRHPALHGLRPCSGGRCLRGCLHRLLRATKSRTQITEIRFIDS